MHDLTVSLMMLIVLALAPWVANAIATRTVDRLSSDEGARARNEELPHLD
jgi:hypothetical protein